MVGGPLSPFHISWARAGWSLRGDPSVLSGVAGGAQAESRTTRTGASESLLESRRPSRTPPTFCVQRGLLNSSGHCPDPKFLSCPRGVLSRTLVRFCSGPGFSLHRENIVVKDASGVCRARVGLRGDVPQPASAGRVTLVGLCMLQAGCVAGPRRWARGPSLGGAVW